jgi:hypothetical protein
MNKLLKDLNTLLGIGVLTLSSAFAELPKFNNVTVTVVGDAGQNMERELPSSRLARHLQVSMTSSKQTSSQVPVITTWSSFIHPTSEISPVMVIWRLWTIS